MVSTWSIWRITDATLVLKLELNVSIGFDQYRKLMQTSKMKVA